MQSDARFVVLCLCLAVVTSTAAHCGTIYNSLEPYCCAGENIGYYQNASLRHAVGFRAPQTFELTSVSFNLIGSSGSTGSFIVDIFSDNGATLHTPGTLIASYAVPFPSEVSPSAFPSFIFTAQAPASIVLQADQLYWISPWVSDESAWALWWYNLAQIGYRAAQPIGTSSWFPSCGTNDCAPLATRVDGTAVVPEPSVLPIWAGLSLVGIMLRAKLRQK